MDSEAKRLAKIDELKLAGEVGASPFQTIARAAANAFGAPIGAITVLDRDTQWFYAAFGLDVPAGPRCDSFCTRTIESDAPMIVEDACLDAAWCDNAHVVRHPHLRFYAGAPIVLEPGVRIGAVIVIDDAPRRPDPVQIEQLRGLADIVADAFRLREALVEQRRLLTEVERQRRAAVGEHAALVESQKLFDAASELAKFGSWSLDVASGRMTWSEGMYRIHEVPGDFEPTLDKVVALVEPEHRGLLRRRHQALVERGGRDGVDLTIATPDGRRKWVRTVACAEGAGGAVERVYGCLLDVSDEKRSLHAIEELATRDMLTGLLNRRSLEERYDALVASLAADDELTLLLVDVDHFKTINDTEGHDVGDEMLQEIGDVLKSVVRDVDPAGRLGGDEFLVLARAPKASRLGDELANRIQEGVAGSRKLGGLAVPVGLSIGVAHVAEPELAFSVAMKRADLALYEAKRQGRAQVAVYDSGLGDAFHVRQSTLRAVDHALRAGQIVPCYQPTFCLETGALAGFEALARWQHPERGLLAPGAFREAIDDPALATRISEAVLATLVADAARLRALGLRFGRLAINVTELQLLDNGFLGRLDEWLAANAVGYGDLTIELTENILLSRRTETIRQRLETLSARGAQIAFDDFGTGFASLTHLREFRIDRLKIDTSFVRTLTTDSSSAAIVSGLVYMAHKLGIEVVAEGIEDGATERCVREMGCDVGQGWHYARPLPLDGVVAFIRALPPHREAAPRADRALARVLPLAVAGGAPGVTAGAAPLR